MLITSPVALSTISQFERSLRFCNQEFEKGGHIFLILRGVNIFRGIGGGFQFLCDFRKFLVSFCGPSFLFISYIYIINKLTLDMDSFLLI